MNTAKQENACVDAAKQTESDAAKQLLSRIARVRQEVAAMEASLLCFGANNKSQARKVADIRENLSELEAQLINRREVK
jgi:septal ring factor EnvC (AmiA/AmiB activator)